MSIGDLDSDARGSGARKNTGKPDLSLVPLRIIVDSYFGMRLETALQIGARSALLRLAEWQERCPGQPLHEAWQLLGPPAEVASECAKVFDYGRRVKYKAWNWAKGMPWSVPLACAARHLVEIIEGVTVDHESGEATRGHVACNLAMLMTYERTYPEGDDRAPAGLLNVERAAA